MGSFSTRYDLELTKTRIGSTKLVILGGLAELFAGSISMGLGAYLATVTDAHHFRVEEAREQRQVTGTPQLEGEILVEIFTKYGLSREEILPILQSFRQNPESWVNVSTPISRYSAKLKVYSS